ncbi:MAG: DUF6498-containing protein, partial [bacterium]
MKKLDSSEIVLILANCVPLAGVLFFGWSLFSLLISFWLETGVLLIFVFIKTINYLGAEPTRYDPRDVLS